MAIITGNDFKAIRKQLGLTQQAMAEELGVSRPTISGWEKQDEGHLDRLIYLAVQALLKIPETRRFGADGHLTFGEEKS
jgi:transcriptional regulator with XRE-family HTH domain